jgi:alpha-D-ribose 1-methylphosphonate 5-triphosphate synthase subunit PhnH
VFAEECRAANALHCEIFNCLSLASIDANLQRVIAAWEKLSKAAKAAILALLDV